MIASRRWLSKFKVQSNIPKKGQLTTHPRIGLESCQVFVRVFHDLDQTEALSKVSTREKKLVSGMRGSRWALERVVRPLRRTTICSGGVFSFLLPRLCHTGQSI